MRTRQCAVCGKVLPENYFGDGIKCPKTTCLKCYKIAREEARKEARDEDNKIR